MKYMLERSHNCLGIFLSLVLFSLSSCAPALYAPNEAYMMGVSKQGDLKVGASFLGGRVSPSLFDSSRTKVRQYHAQVAYSPINRLAIAGSYTRLTGKGVGNPTNWDAQNLELALGFYHKSGKDTPEDQSYVLSDLYVGSGWGNTNSVFRTAGESHLNYQRLFVHSGIQFWWKNNIAVGFGLRYVNLNYSKADLFGPIPNDYQSGINFIKDRNSHNLLESTFSIQGGNNLVKIFTSFTGALIAKTDAIQTRITYPSANLGLVFSVDQFFRKKENRDKW